MASYVSDKGVVHPAKEKVGLTNNTDHPFEHKGKTINPGEPFIYNGPDRAAVEELARVNGLDIDSEKSIEDIQTTFGNDFRKDPEFLQSVRNQGFNTVDEYLKFIDYNEEADIRKFKEKAAAVKTHDLPKRSREIFVMGGGKDMAGARQDSIGGFGEQRLRAPAEVKGK